MDIEPKGLGDFTIGGPDSGTDEISAAAYREEFNELRIEKLGNRITIISVILPCLIGAILFFAYMDIKDRMANVHDTGQNEVQEVAEDLGVKLNAMTVDIAGVKHQLETQFPVVDQTIKTLDSQIAKLTTAKAEKNETKKELDRIDKLLSDNAARNTRTLKALKTLETTSNKTIARTVKTEKTTAEKTKLLKSSITKLTMALKAEQGKVAILTKDIAGYGETIAFLQKEVSLVKKKADTLDQLSVDRRGLDHKLDQIRSEYDEKINRLVRLVEKTAKTATPAQTMTSDSILEKDLLQ